MRRLALFAILSAPMVAVAAADVSVFNQGASVVTEARSYNLQQGSQDITWPDLPEQIVPQTLLLQGDGVTLAGSRYVRDTLNAQSLLERFEGRNVTLLRDDGQGGDVTRNAVLLSAARPLIVRVDERVEVLDANSPWRVALDRLPPALPASPALSLNVVAQSADKKALRLTYQVNGLGWQGEYVGRYDDEAQSLSLRASAVLQNNSGGDFDDANINLIAGDIARANQGGPRMAMMRSKAFDSEAAAPPSASPAFEYYRYDLPGRITLANGESRSVSLFNAKNIDVTREYRIDDGWRSNGEKSTANAEIRVRFDNTLDKPLPAGTVRVYDASASPLLLGEDQIGHTAEKQPVTLTLGQAFDITGERKVVEQSRDGQTRESQRRIVLSNAKSRSVNVKLVERMPGSEWEILSESLPHTKVDANRAEWVLGVPGGGKAVLNYRVRYR